MMLPSGRSETIDQRKKELDKGKRFHIKKRLAHPEYNRTVFTMVRYRKWKKGYVSYKQFVSLAKTLRNQNRPKRTGTASGFVDDIVAK